LFSGEVGFDEMTQRQTGWKVLLANNITVWSFYNAVNTIGVDVVLNYKNLEIGTGRLGFSLASNINITKIDGKIATPPILSANGYDIFNRKEQGRILKQYKSIVRNELWFKTTFILTTYFGEAQHAIIKRSNFAGKVITDFGAYKFTALSAVVNNLQCIQMNDKRR
jgi:iron complex outermembrane receptor protein